MRNEQNVDADWYYLHHKGPHDLNFRAQNFMDNEIRKAIFSMAKNKAPRPNSFPLSFYQNYWKLFKFDPIQVIHDFQNQISDISRFNFIFISLIPKVSSDATIKDFRPISLDHAIIKIISKILSNCLKKIMGNLASPSQNAFNES